MSKSQLGPVAYPEDPRLLGIPRYLGLVFLLGFPMIFSLKGWAELLFSLFRKAQSLPTRGLESRLIDFLMNLGLALSLKAQMALRFQSFCIVLALIQYCDILDLNIG